MRIKSPEAVWTSPILPISSTVFYQVDPPLVKASYFLFRQTAVLWPSDFVKLALLCKNDPWLDGHVKINPHGNAKSFIEHGTETMCGSFTIHKAPLEQLWRALLKTHTHKLLDNIINALHILWFNINSAAAVELVAH